MSSKIHTVIAILQNLKYLIFCSFISLIFKIFVSMMNIIKQGSAKSVEFLVARLMCSGGCSSRYARQDEESFTTQEIYYKENHGASTADNDGECCMDENTEHGNNAHKDRLSRRRKDLECSNHTTTATTTSTTSTATAFHSEETGKAFRCRSSQKGQSDFRKLALAGALQHDNEQQQQQISCHQQPYSFQTTIPIAGITEAQV